MQWRRRWRVDSKYSPTVTPHGWSVTSLPMLAQVVHATWLSLSRQERRQTATGLDPSGVSLMTCNVIKDRQSAVAGLGTST